MTARTHIFQDSCPHVLPSHNKETLLFRLLIAFMNNLVKEEARGCSVLSLLKNQKRQEHLNRARTVFLLFLHFLVDL